MEESRSLKKDGELESDPIQVFTLVRTGWFMSSRRPASKVSTMYGPVQWKAGASELYMYVCVSTPLIPALVVVVCVHRSSSTGGSGVCVHRSSSTGGSGVCVHRSSSTGGSGVCASSCSGREKTSRKIQQKISGDVLRSANRLLSMLWSFC